MKLQLKSPLSPANLDALRPFRDRRWPDGFVLFAPWLFPSTATCRLFSISRKQLLIFHALGLLLIWPAMLAVRSAHRFVHGDTWEQVIPNYVDALTNSVGNAIGDPIATLKLAGITLLITESGLALIALLLVPIGARSEPFDDSFRHAFRRVWLHSGQIPVLVFLVATAQFLCLESSGQWEARARHQAYEVRPLETPVNPGAKRLGPTQAADAARVVRNNREIADYLQQKPRPFFVKYETEFLAVIFGIIGAWFLWTVTRGVLAWRPVVREPQPPRCRRCGYVLIGMAMDGQCPECAYPVAKSIANDVDPGCPWTRGRFFSAIPAYVATWFQFMLSPVRSARKLRAFEHSAHAPRFLIITGILIAVAWGLIGRSGTYLGARKPLSDWLLICASVGLVVMGFASFSALWVSWQFNRMDNRNMLKGVHNVSVYTSGYLALMLLILACVFWHTTWIFHVLGYLVSTVGWSPTFVLYGGILLVALLFWGGYTVIVRVAAQGIRHAFR